MDPRYAVTHANRANLLIHAVAVPLFAYGTLRAAWLLGTGHPFRAWAWLFVPFFSLMAQGIGHRRERVPPEKFSGVRDFLTRILAEQFLRFWVFLLGGGWLRQYRRHSQGST